jgi:hypothetical protein
MTASGRTRTTASSMEAVTLGVAGNQSICREDAQRPHGGSVLLPEPVREDRRAKNNEHDGHWRDDG